MKRLIALFVCLGALTVGTSASLASSSTSCSYGLCNVAANTQSKSPNNSATTASNTNASSLPFTGLDVGLLLVGGGVLLGTGLFVRRLSAETGRRD